ncbi:MAG: hypothetical protein AAGF11_01105 [Myxococcota bacterium]
MKPPTGTDAERLRGLLDELGDTIEQLLMGGMTTASRATRQKLDVAFREASKRQLSRLAVSLRVVMQQVEHYLAKDPKFSPRRLSMFCNRVWVLARGMANSMKSDDTERFAHLALDRRLEAVDAIEAVTLGVMKKMLPGVCAFDFHMRVLNDGALGSPAVYSLVFPLKKGSKIPPEALLELALPQKWKPRILLDGTVITFHHPTLVHDPSGLRIQTPRDNPKSKAEAGPAFDDWEQLPGWDPALALRRVREHEIDPIEIPNELQELAVFDDWRLSAAREDENRPRHVYPVHTAGLELDGIASSEAEGATLRDNLQRILAGKLPVGHGPGAPKSQTKTKTNSRKRSTQNKTARPKASPDPSPPRDPRAGRLFGIVHYETCRLVMHPLSLITQRGPIHLMVASEGVDKKALLKSLKF